MHASQVQLVKEGGHVEGRVEAGPLVRLSPSLPLYLLGWQLVMVDPLDHRPDSVDLLDLDHMLQFLTPYLKLTLEKEKWMALTERNRRR